MKAKLLTFLLPLIFMVSFISATSLMPSTNQITLTNINPSQQITITNNGNSTYSLTTTPSEISLSSLTIPGNVTNFPLTISISSSAPIGNYTRQLIFNDGTTINISIQNNPVLGNPQSCQLYTYPYTSTYQITQGSSGQGNQIKIVANNCPSLTFNDVTPSSGGSFVNIASKGQTGQTYTFTLGWDTTGVPVGTYTNTYQVSATDSQGNVYTLNNPISVSLVVTQGISPISNFSASNLPSCSLTTTNLQINQTYSLSCTNLNPNIIISPQINPQYLIGNGISITSNTYNYNFIPLNPGVTNVTANFLYDNALVGIPFTQEVTISSNGQAPGTGMYMQFSPSIDSFNQSLGPYNTVVQAIDNATQSLITDATFYLNGVQVNNTLTLQPGVNYTLRAHAEGYNDNVQYIYINPQFINITISPNPLIANTPVYVNVTPYDASVFIDGSSLTLTNGTGNITLSAGNHNLVAIDQGYVQSNLTLDVLNQIGIVSTTQWILNTPQYVVLNREANWTILYAKDNTSSYSVIMGGQSQNISYTPQNRGNYEIQANGLNLGIYSIPPAPIVTFFKNTWVIWVVAVVVIFLVILILKQRGGSGGGISLPAGAPSLLQPL